MALATDLRPGIMMIPVLENEGLEVLAFTLDAEPEMIRAVGTVLSEDECRRTNELKSERDRRRFILARGQLRQVLASRLGIPPSEIELEYGRQGKPSLSRRMPGRTLQFNLSRSQDIAVIALSTDGAVGVDVEAIRAVPEADDIAALCFSAAEHKSYCKLRPEDRLEGFLRSWTRLEAISKALGCGLGSAPSSDERGLIINAFVPKPGYVGTVVVRN
jgi:4'-phosphopantetheinyl transferase